MRRARNDYFYAYRRGQGEGPPSNVRKKLVSQRYNLKVYQGVVQDESFPVKTNEGLLRYEDYFREKDKADAWAIKHKPEEREKQLKQKQERNQKMALAGWRAAKVLAKFMYVRKGTGLHFVKVLGAGGMGIISVFVSYDKNGTRTFWTVKRDKPGCRDVANEKEMTSVSASIWRPVSFGRLLTGGVTTRDSSAHLTSFRSSIHPLMWRRRRKSSRRREVTTICRRRGRPSKQERSRTKLKYGRRVAIFGGAKGSHPLRGRRVQRNVSLYSSLQASPHLRLRPSLRSALLNKQISFPTP